MAGLPNDVLSAAQSKLALLEAQAFEVSPSSPPKAPHPQQTLDLSQANIETNKKSGAVLNELNAIDADDLSARDALNLIYKLKNLL